MLFRSLSHRILTQLQDYMVMVAEVDPPPFASSPAPINTELTSTLTVPPPSTATASNGTNTSSSNNNESDERLFKELIEMDYLNGDVSIMALSWRMAIDPQKLRRWGSYHKRVRVISRVPTSGDDWDSPTVSHSLSG